MKLVTVCSNEFVDPIRWQAAWLAAADTFLITFIKKVEASVDVVMDSSPKNWDFGLKK